MVKTAEDKFIEWFEFQFRFNVHNVTKIAIKSRLKQYAQQVSRKQLNDSFWFDQFNEKYPDEVSEILDNRQK